MEAKAGPAHDRRIRRERDRSERVLLRLLPEIPGGDSHAVVEHDHRGSNDLLEVRVGRRHLMVKRGLEPWSAERYGTARVASRRIAGATAIRTPEYLDLPDLIEGSPVLAWWRLDHPTLERLWPRLDGRRRGIALESLGRLMAKLHAVPVEWWGPLRSGPPGERLGLEYLEHDLSKRLRPAIHGAWPAALPLVQALLHRVRNGLPAARRPCLVHNDVHLANVICEVDADGSPRCLGFLDLEAVGGALPEADLSYLALVHSPLMAGTLGEGWLERVLDGHGHEPDDELMVAFRLHHILNIGIHAALNGAMDMAAHLAELGRSSL